MARIQAKAAAVPVGSWGEREDGILDVAEALFQKHGYEAVSMAMVARAAGLSEGTLYNYFADKRDLVVRVGQRLMRHIVAEAEQAAAAADSLRAGFEALVAINLRIVFGQKEIYRMLMREVRADRDYSRAANRDTFRAYTDVFFTLLGRFCPNAVERLPLSLSMMRDLLYGGTEHVAWNAILRQREQDIDIPALSRLLVGTLLKGFGLEGLEPATAQAGAEVGIDLAQSGGCQDGLI